MIHDPLVSSPADRLRRWHPRFVPCAVCTRPAAGFGFFDPRSRIRPRGRRWFCSMTCQAAHARRAKATGGLPMFGTTSEERLAIAITLRRVATMMEEIGWERRLGDLSETEVTVIVEETIEAFQEAMSRIAGERSAEVPF
ncbi:MAG: DUF6511 domain-containing protein [Amaricoccus sp.]